MYTKLPSIMWICPIVVLVLDQVPHVSDRKLSEKLLTIGTCVGPGLIGSSAINEVSADLVVQSFFHGYLVCLQYDNS